MAFTASQIVNIVKLRMERVSNSLAVYNRDGTLDTYRAKLPVTVALLREWEADPTNLTKRDAFAADTVTYPLP